MVLAESRKEAETELGHVVLESNPREHKGLLFWSQIPTLRLHTPRQFETELRPYPAIHHAIFPNGPSWILENHPTISQPSPSTQVGYVGISSALPVPQSWPRNPPTRAVPCVASSFNRLQHDPPTRARQGGSSAPGNVSKAIRNHPYFHGLYMYPLVN